MKNLDKAIIAFIEIAKKDSRNFTTYPEFIYCHSISCESCPLGNFNCNEAREHLSCEVQEYIETKYPEVLL
jgi:hypothetical protein